MRGATPSVCHGSARAVGRADGDIGQVKHMPIALCLLWDTVSGDRRSPVVHCKRHGHQHATNRGTGSSIMLFAGDAGQALTYRS